MAECVEEFVEYLFIIFDKTIVSYGIKRSNEKISTI
jgi:hypothetical protein